MSQIPSWSNQGIVMLHAGCVSVFGYLYVDKLVRCFLGFTVTYPNVGQTGDPVGSVVNFPLIFEIRKQEMPPNTADTERISQNVANRSQI